MNNLFDTVKELRRRIERYSNLLRNSEALTRYVLIDPLLRALDWNTEDPDLVRPEETQEGGTPDYILYLEGTKFIALEAKKLGTKIDEKGILELGFRYSWNNKIPYFIITDGNVWKVYNMMKLGSELILEINLLEEPLEDVVRKLLALWRPLIREEIKTVSTISVSYVQQASYAERSSLIEVGEKLDLIKKGKVKGPVDLKLAQFLILYILREAGGPLSRKSIMNKVSEIVEFTYTDLEKVKSGKVRWRSTVDWGISRLRMEGYIKRVRRGVYKITEAGLHRLREMEKEVSVNAA